MNAAVQRRNTENARLRSIAEKNRQSYHARNASRQSSAQADEKLARLRKIREARVVLERKRAHIRRLANPVRLVLIGSFLFYLGLGGLYFVSVARDLI
jgi:hypothetical protein